MQSSNSRFVAVLLALCLAQGTLAANFELPISVRESVDRSALRFENNAAFLSKQAFAFSGVGRYSAGRSRSIRPLAALAAIVIGLGVTPWYSAPKPAAASPYVEAYQRALKDLSEPASRRWSDPVQPDLRYNILGFDRLYHRVERRGGTMIAIGFFQNLSLIPHVQPDNVVFVDINPVVTEVAIPLVGRLLEKGPLRADFLSFVIGVPITNEETLALLEPVEPAGLSAEASNDALIGHIEGTLETVLKKRSVADRQAEQRKVTDLLMQEIAPRLPVSGWPRPHADLWLEPLFRVFSTIDLYIDQASASWDRKGAPRETRAGWLSTEANYRSVRNSWMEGRWLGATGDIAGPIVSNIAARLRGRQVATLYLSCVTGDVEENEKSLAAGRRIFKALTQLPLSPHAIIIGAFGEKHNASYVMPFRVAAWGYEYLNASDENLRRKIIDTVLQWTPDAQEFWNELHFGVHRVLHDRGTPHDERGVLGYTRLTDAIQRSLKEVRQMTPSDFEQWARRMSPGIDTSTDYFRAYVVTLVQAELLQLQAPRAIGKAA